MFKKIFQTEFFEGLKKPSYYIYYFIFFTFAFMGFIGSAGFFDPVKGQPADDFLNAPYQINYMVQYFNKFFLFLLPAIVGAQLYKDYKYKVHSILYTFPMQKRDYLFGKFLSGMTWVLLICTSFYVALFIGEFIPGLHPHHIGPTQIMGYIQSFFIFTLPNMLIWGGVVFALVLRFRNVYAGFGLIILLFFVQIITENALSDHPYLIALFDPFGQNTVSYVVQNWTADQFNSALLPVQGVIGYNRIFYLGLSGFLFFLAYRNFKFHENIQLISWSKKQGSKIKSALNSSSDPIVLPKVKYNYSLGQQIKTTWHLSNTYTRYMLKNWMFLGMVFLAVLAITFMLNNMVSRDGMAILPTTSIVLSLPLFFYTKIIILLTFIYTGMLIHRERSSEIYQLVDTAPVRNGTFIFAKFLAVLKMQASLLVVMMLTGVILQTFHGYYTFELGVYLYHLFVVVWINLILWAVAAFVVHTLVNHTYLGIFLLFMGWIGFGLLPDLGWDSKSYLFNSPDLVQYNDLLGYGDSLKTYFWIESYWSILGVVLILITFLFWVRGSSRPFSERWKLGMKRWNLPLKISAVALIATFIFYGFKIYDEEQKSMFSDEQSMEQKFKVFEENFSKYDHVKTPKIISHTLSLDLFPEEQNFKAKGSYVLVNKTDQAIDTLLVKTGFEEVTTFEISRPYTQIDADEYVKFYVLLLNEKLAPGDSIQFDFEVKNQDHTMFEKNSNVLSNGTYMKSDFLPKFGYFLHDKNQDPKLASSLLDHYQAIDSDLVSFETTLSTSLDQKAIAPGYLVEQWIEGERKYYKYKMSRKIKNVLGFHSGKYETYVEDHNDIKLEINYHQGHDQNIETMMSGMKAALDYNTQYFSPYQHSEAKMIEFPRSLGSFATTAGNTISTSEMRFLSNSDTSGLNIDLSFYVPSHELTHQWWGNQVIPAGAAGSLMLTESITEYISLQIYEDQYGKEQALAFLKMQAERYLRRKRNSDPPLMLVRPDQNHLAYGKGAVAFHTLSHFWGEENVNKVLQEFLLENQFQETQYPTALDLIERFDQAVPDSIAYIIADYFKTVTFYDNQIKSAQISENSNGSYTVVVDLKCSKYQIAKDGARTYPGGENLDQETMPLNDFIEIAWYDSEGQIQGIHRAKIQNETSEISFQVTSKPISIRVDPNCLTLDEDYEDQVYSF